MNYLVAAAWFRSLARLHAQALSEQGARVLLVTTDVPDELSLCNKMPDVSGSARIRSRQSVSLCLRAQALALRASHDAVLVDDTWDPRFVILAKSARRRGPLIVLVHDERPHDETHADAFWKARSRRYLRDSADAFFCFSTHTASLIRHKTSRPVFNIPLTSDHDIVHERVDDKRDFVIFGRDRPYKNTQYVLDSWADFKRAVPHNRDKLLVTGHMENYVYNACRSDVEWLPAGLTYRQILPTLASARALACVYSAASQSGVQILAAQQGTATICSTAGGLQEYQPVGAPVVNLLARHELLDAFRFLSADNVSNNLGKLAQETYNKNWTPTHVALAIERALVTLRGSL
jgi:glycosyltransferase involved in cell wall biosynthesis